MSDITHQDPVVLETDSVLGAGGVFESPVRPIGGARIITVMVHSDQGSAANGLEIRQTLDPSVPDQLVQTFSVGAGTAFTQTITVFGDFLSIKYTNGATPQTTFNLKAKAFAI